MSRIVITGASGLLGANLAKAALDAGHEVICTRRTTSKIAHLEDLEITWKFAPLGDVHALSQAFDGAKVVFHCAARTSVLPSPTPGLVASNVTGTLNVIEAVNRAGVERLVHTSSTVAVGVSDDDTPCTESQEWNLEARGLADGYATTKRQSELAVLQAVHEGLDAVVVNPGYMFGPFDARPSSGTMILEVASGIAKAHTAGRNSFADARQVAQGMLLAAERGTTGERYILAGENLTYGDVFTKIAAVVGKPPPRFAIPRWVAAPAGWAGDVAQWWTGKERAITSNTLAWGFERGFIADSTKATRELGYEMGSVDAGIEAAWAWFQKMGRA